MIFCESNLRFWLCTQPTDMRKSFDGLSALVASQLEVDPLSGHCFVFINKRKTRMKILYFDRTGYCIGGKRLEQGQFNASLGTPGKRPLDSVPLNLLLAGIEIQKHRQYKRFNRP